VRLATAAISEDRGGHNLPDKGTAWSLHEEHFAAYADRKCRAVPSLLRTNELNPDWGVVVETKGQSPLLAVDHRTGSLGHEPGNECFLVKATIYVNNGNRLAPPSKVCFLTSSTLIGIELMCTQTGDSGAETQHAHYD
jgi:hypothetical protein